MPALPASWQAMPACVDPLAVLRKAQDIHPTHDLIVLEADAVLPDGWWPRLMSAFGAGDGFDVISTLGSRHSALDPFAQAAADALPAIPDPDALCWLLGDHALFDCAMASRSDRTSTRLNSSP